MSKSTIFNHFINTFITLGKLGHYKVIENVNKVLITGFQEHSYNILSIGNLDATIFDHFFQSKVPFLCLPQENIESVFDNFCLKSGLKKGGLLLGHIYTPLSRFHYSSKKNVEIHQITTEHELQIFDKISSTCFDEDENCAFNLLLPSLDNKLFRMYLAYEKDIPVACCMLSLVNDEAGLYWDGVLPAYRNKGIGSELVKYRMNVAKDLGYNSICSQNVDASKGYYQEIGFTPQGEVQGYLYLGDTKNTDPDSLFD